jgi:glycosyltransferase involved in cell wall biosynthesis
MNDKTIYSPEINDKSLIKTIPSRLIKKPLVSVSMITYNHEKYIEEAINGVLMQVTDFEVELIISNDNSPDQTDTIIQRIIKEHPKGYWIKYIKHEKNLGAIPNSMDNFKQCSGEYIAICEGDDYWTDPSKLQKQVCFLQENNDYVITYTSVEAFDENGIIENYIGGAKCDLDSIDLQKATPINTLTTCFRNVVTNYPYEYNFSKIGDLFIWALLADYGKGKYIENITPARYRIHSGGIYSTVKQEEKSYMRFTLNSALLSYHHRIGNKEAEIYFKKLIFKSSIFSFKFGFVIKEVISIFWVKLIYKIHKSTRIN